MARSNNVRGIRIACVLILALSASLLHGCARSGVTGKYLATFSNGLYWLQLVETPDKHITGQLDILIMGADGKIDYQSFAVQGVADGESVSLSFKQLSILPTTLSGSGTLTGDHLSLTGNLNPGQLSTVVFNRTDEDDYKSAVSAIKEKSEHVVAEKAAANNMQRVLAIRRAFVVGATDLMARLDKFDAEADSYLAQWLKATDSYRAISAKIENSFNHERQLAHNNEATVERGQIVVAMSQTSIDTDQLHNTVETIRMDFEGKIGPLAQQSEALDRVCNEKTTQATAIEVRQVCEKIVHAMPTFTKKYDAMKGGFEHLEQVYQQEHQKQVQMIRSAQQIE